MLTHDRNSCWRNLKILQVIRVKITAVCKHNIILKIYNVFRHSSHCCSLVDYDVGSSSIRSAVSSIGGIGTGWVWVCGQASPLVNAPAQHNGTAACPGSRPTTHDTVRTFTLASSVHLKHSLVSIIYCSQIYIHWKHEPKLQYTCKIIRFLGLYSVLTCSCCCCRPNLTLIRTRGCCNLAESQRVALAGGEGAKFTTWALVNFTVLVVHYQNLLNLSSNEVVEFNIIYYMDHGYLKDKIRVSYRYV